MATDSFGCRRDHVRERSDGGWGTSSSLAVAPSALLGRWAFSCAQCFQCISCLRKSFGGPVLQSFKDSSSGAVGSSSKVRLLESDPSVTPTPWDQLCHLCTKSLNLSMLWFIHQEIRGHKAVPLYFPGGATCRYGGGRLRRQGVL